MKKRSIISAVFLILLVFPLVYAFNASSSSYTIGSYHTSVTGNDASSDSYELESTLTYQQGSSDFAGSTYQGDSGLFEDIMFCGDSICNNGETCSSCSTDCGSCPVTLGGYSDDMSVLTPAKEKIKLIPTEEKKEPEIISEIDEYRTPDVLPKRDALVGQAIYQKIKEWKNVILVFSSFIIFLLISFTSYFVYRKKKKLKKLFKELKWKKLIKKINKKK